MSNRNTDRLRVASEMMYVLPKDHRSVVRCERSVCKISMMIEENRAEILLFMGWKDLGALWPLSDLLCESTNLRGIVNEVSFFNLPNSQSQNEIVSKLLASCIFFL